MSNHRSGTLITILKSPCCTHKGVLIYFKLLLTVVEGDPNAPFSIATTPRCRGGRYSIPWIAPVYPWSVPYNHHHHHHHHHIALVARISLTLSRHSSLSFIALGRSSGQHPVSSHSCWMYVRAGRPAFARPCVGIHKSKAASSTNFWVFGMLRF